jgi:hypothetical protein
MAINGYEWGIVNAVVALRRECETMYVCGFSVKACSHMWVDLTSHIWFDLNPEKYVLTLFNPINDS